MSSVEVKEPTHWSKIDLKVIKVCFFFVGVIGLLFLLF